ncbi:presequence protease 2 [Hibiscus syriacus]|uniref:Presequence protease 2 n=1 Tax=Hibiscus syriacus TaxID=106335 RepID=A0A6A2X0Z1_HIBSY|nr:probable carboxylesterase 12 [Hibiscus syriacus]KAE8668108.1 presequence protease 2 [Hibiscus syriacus]
MKAPTAPSLSPFSLHFPKSKPCAFFSLPSKNLNLPNPKFLHINPSQTPPILSIPSRKSLNRTAQYSSPGDEIQVVAGHMFCGKTAKLLRRLQAASNNGSTPEIAHEFFPSFPIFRVYKDGRIERLRQTETVPPCDDPRTGVRSKDSPVSTLTSARIFIPRTTDPSAKIPLLIYIHGGGFCLESPFSPAYHNYLTSLVNRANVIAVSVEYRKAPEHLLPIAYDDAWTAIKWVASHAKRDGPEPWLNERADFDRVFLAGDSSGANIAHNMIMRAAGDELLGLKFDGLLLTTPFFMNQELDEFMEFIFPTSSGPNDPRLNPGCAIDELAAGLVCKRVLVCVAEKDFLRETGVAYYETVKKSGWNGDIEMVEIQGEEHVFYLLKPASEKTVDLLNLVSSFLNT